MITISRSEYEFLMQEIACLRRSVQRLEAENALLRGGKDSRTSSTAPSQDIGRSNKNSLRTPSGKKPGGQLGHTGYTLSMSKTPNEIVDHRPLKCDRCGEELQGVVSDSFACRQIVDIPVVSPTYIEHRVHVKTCPLCKFENHGFFPEGLQSPIQYGVRVEAMAGYLSVYQTIPYNRIVKLFKDFFGLPLSEGSIDTFLDRLSRKSSSIYTTIRARVLESEVVGADETGCRVNGKKHWFHVWQTPVLTFIVSYASRGYKVIEKYFADGFPHSVYVSDCWSSQLKVKTNGKQLCMAHLLRELTNFTENLKSEWSARVKKLFQIAIELKNKMTMEDYQNSSMEIEALKTELEELLKVDFSKFHRKEQAFIKRLIKHRQSIFTFLTHPDVPSDNNASERAIRNVKTKTKVSGQFRNKDGKGADRYAKIRSVIDTTIKNGQDIYAALVCLANCKIVAVPE